MGLLKIHSGWALAGGILFVIIIYNLWSRGNVTTSVFGGVEQFVLNMTKALEVTPQ
jgi:hypothetical protein